MIGLEMGLGEFVLELFEFLLELFDFILFVD